MQLKRVNQILAAEKLDLVEFNSLTEDERSDLLAVASKSGLTKKYIHFADQVHLESDNIDYFERIEGVLYKVRKPEMSALMLVEINGESFVCRLPDLSSPSAIGKYIFENDIAFYFAKAKIRVLGYKLEARRTLIQNDLNVPDHFPDLMFETQNQARQAFNADLVPCSEFSETPGNTMRLNFESETTYVDLDSQLPYLQVDFATEKKDLARYKRRTLANFHRSGCTGILSLELYWNTTESLTLDKRQFFKHTHSTKASSRVIARWELP